MSTTDTRAAFEAQEKHNSSNLKRDDTGQYENPCTQSAWEGWQAALAWQAATEAAKPAQEEDSQIRWCAEGQIFGRPTATDALEYAEQRLRDPEEMSCCKSDIRLDAMLNVRELLSAAKATGTAGELPPLPDFPAHARLYTTGLGRRTYRRAATTPGEGAPLVLVSEAKAIAREYGQACAEAARQPAPAVRQIEILLRELIGIGNSNQRGVGARVTDILALIHAFQSKHFATTNRNQP